MSEALGNQATGNQVSADPVTVNEAPELAVRGVDAFYGTSHILYDVALEVPPGSAVVILGRNGAGKTTLFKSIMGLGPKVNGEVHLFGENVTKTPAHKLARQGVAYVPDDRRIYASFDVVENLHLGDYAIGKRDVTPMTTEEIFTLFPLLERLEDRRGGQLSGGEQQLLAIARALVARPRIMLLDEPSEGLAPVIVNSLVDAIVDLRKTTGMTMLLAEQNVPFAMRLASHIYVLEQGRMVWNGTKDEFDASPEVKDKHLAI